jgi:hypothetical protein
MDGLNHDRVTRLSEWRNTAWKARKSNFDKAGEADEAAANAAASQPLPDRLTVAVKRQVIPQLLVAHPLGHAEPAESVADIGIDVSDVIEFTTLVASREIGLARAKIELKRASGLSLESLFLHLLVPAARRLSDLWESDSCHYEEIAVGMLNLQQLLHDLSLQFSNERPRRFRDQKVLLLSAPSEQSMLGVFMVTEFYRCMASEFFHRDGWEVWPAPPMSLPQLLGVIGSQWFDLIEVSATCGARLPILARELAQLRRASRNAQIGMILCGPAFDDHPELLGEIGADACAHNAKQTMFEAETFIERRDRPV